MEKIKVKNNLRRPVIFRVPGKTIRLGAGQETELPGHCKEAQELKTLYLRKCVSVLEEKKEEKKEKPVEETAKIETKVKKPGKAPKKAAKARGKKSGDTGGDKKPHPLEEE
jgi:hypothetical protein